LYRIGGFANDHKIRPFTGLNHTVVPAYQKLPGLLFFVQAPQRKVAKETGFTIIDIL
jgi:hypothetical protein